MKVKLGRESSKDPPRTTLVARSDGGCSFATSRKSECTYSAIPVEVTVALCSSLTSG